MDDEGELRGEAFASTLSAAQAGSSWALAALYRSLDPAVRRYLRAQLGPDGEDVASETWLSVAQSIATFEGDEDRFRAFVFTIANRRVVDHLRIRGRRPVLADVVPETIVEASSAEDEAFAGALGDEAARRIVACLPEDQARVVLLRVVAGLSVDEVAVLLDRRPATIRVMQHRALRRLAKEILWDV